MTIGAESPVEGAPLAAEPGRARKYAIAGIFLAPAFVLLVVWVVYPAVYTIIRSFFGQSGFGDFVGGDNYKTLKMENFPTDGNMIYVRGPATATIRCS